MSKFNDTLEERFLKRKNRLLIASVAIILAFTVGLLPHEPLAKILAETKQSDTEYVSDVRIYTAASPEAAKALCQNDGFIPVDGDLNDGANGGSVVLGYQTTTDVEQAVTDVRMMQMTSGFRREL